MCGGADFFCTCDPKNSWRPKFFIVSGLLELVIGDHLSVCVTVFVCEYFCVCNCVYVCVGDLQSLTMSLSVLVTMSMSILASGAGGSCGCR